MQKSASKVSRFETSTLLLVRFFITYAKFCFCCILYVYVYVLCELFFSIDNAVRLLSYVNMCACHVYFTKSLLTYLLERTDGQDRSHYLPR